MWDKEILYAQVYTCWLKHAVSYYYCVHADTYKTEKHEITRQRSMCKDSRGRRMELRHWIPRWETRWPHGE